MCRWFIEEEFQRESEKQEGRKMLKCTVVATGKASADPIGALELGWTFRIVSN